MWIEIGAPCSLLLGLVPAEAGGVCALAATLEYPPVHLFARLRPGPLSVTGARADAAYAGAQAFAERRGVAAQAELEMELAPPNAMGLGSDAIVALAAARALACLHGQPHEDTPALAQAAGLPPGEAARVWGFHQGGLLEVPAALAEGPIAPPVRRAEISHAADRSWVFVFHFPRLPSGVSAGYENGRLAALLQAAPRLDRAAAGAARDALWSAVQADDLPGFAAAVQQVVDLNAQALAAAGAPIQMTSADREVLEVLRAGGALAAGRPPTGLASFGLAQGGPSSLKLRQKLKDHVGHEGGIVMATVLDNRGARQQEHKKRPFLPVS